METFGDNESNYLLYDDFTLGPLGIANGRIPLIGSGSWVEKNAATSAPVDGVTITSPGTSVITAQGLSSSNAVGGAGVYCTLQLPSVPGEVGFTFSLGDNANQYTPTIALWNGGMFVNVGGIHLQIKNLNAPTDAKTGWNPCYYQGGTGVVPNPWDEEGSNYTQFNQAPGSVYTCRVFPNPPFILYEVLDSAGNLLSTKVAYNSNLASAIGPWFFIETFNTQISYKSVWARKNASGSRSIRQFLGGIDNTPIGVRGAAAGFFSSLHVGSGQPNGVFGANYDANSAYGIPGITATANGPGKWRIGSNAAGYGGELRLFNAGGGGDAKITWDNNYNFQMTDHTGTAFFGKNFNKTPFLPLLPSYANDATAATGGVGLNELYWNSTVNAIVQRRA